MMNYIPQKFLQNIKTNNHLSLNYLDWVRLEHECDIPFCTNMASPHHLLIIGSGRDRKKPMINHFGVIRACNMPHHREAHDLTVPEFNKKYNTDVWEIATNNLMEFMNQLANGKLPKSFKVLKIQYEEL